MIEKRLLPASACRSASVSRVVFMVFLFAPAGILLPAQAWAQATLRGSVVSRHEGKPLSGAIVVLSDAAGKEQARTVSSGDGSFIFEAVPEGWVQIRALCRGFQETTEKVNLSMGRESVLTISMPLKGPTEIIEVSDRPIAQMTATTGGQNVLSVRILDRQPVKGDNFQALLPLLPGVIRGPDGRINIKGASAIQSALLISSSSATDPSTGNPGFELPADAIESIEVLPNPYSVEYGRFSSGVTQIQTRKGDTRWGFLINNFLPRYKWRDGTIMGVEHYTPRLSVGGPIRRNRLVLAQSFQYRLIRTPVPSLPVMERDQSLESFDSFTRLDANLSNIHSLSATVAIFPRKLDFVNLNSFNPKEATANMHNRGWQLAAQESAALGPTTLLESTWSIRSYDANIFGQGIEPMDVYPQGNQGNFFNSQTRRTRTVQWVESFSKFTKVRGGSHMIRLGIDLLYNSYAGSSTSRKINLYRADGSLGTSIKFSEETRQQINAVNLGAYAQDHWRIGDRWSIELGVRLDRDAFPSRINLAPRAGLAFSILPAGQGVIRGGAGLFFEQTPLNIAAFLDYEIQTSLHYADDGLTLVGQPMRWKHVRTPDPHTPNSFIWNVEYAQKLSGHWLLRTNHLQRTGRHEYLIDPIRSDPGSEYRLESRGRSRYWEVELTLRYLRNDNLNMSWSYVRSQSKADLNSYDNYFGNFRNPIIRPNEFAPAGTDVPHRLLYRAILEIPLKLVLSPIVEIRSGYPYAAVNELQDFVAPRNMAGRFPTLATLDVRVTRAFAFWKYTVELGARVYHLLNSFTPRDVQNNVDAPDYGVFYNTIPRNWGFTLQFRK